MARALILLALALTACQPQSGQQASSPPARYQGDAEVAVRFRDPNAAAAICSGAAHEPGVTPEACNLEARTILPNPCAWPGVDTYAQLACHELGHWNGWPADHPQ